MSIKDVARAARVSPSTVSRVVNSGDMSAASPETRERIWHAVRELGYVINQNARSLKRDQRSILPVSRDIDCVIARVMGPVLDPFFVTLLHEIEVEAHKQGFHLRYQYTINDIDKRIHMPNSAARAAAVLGRANEEMIAQLQGIYRYIICTSLQNENLPVDQVISSGYDAAYQCVMYLNTLGHTRICYLGEIADEQRYQGYRAAMRKIGVTQVEDLAVGSPYTAVGGHEAMNLALERGTEFTAVICSNDILAPGALNALKQHKLRVPRDVSIIGINDMETVRYLDPMLTSVHIPIEEMGKITAKTLLDRINGGHKLPLKILLPISLVIRESCARVKAGPTPEQG